MKKLLSILLICVLVLSAGSVCFAANGTEAKQAADTLYGLGLFTGTGTYKNGNPIYSLDRTLTRQEAITMVLSLMGKTEEARQTVSTTHFTDVDTWAIPYVGYAFRAGITAGVSTDSFGAHRDVTATEEKDMSPRSLVNSIPPVPRITFISPAPCSCVSILRMMTGLVPMLPARKSLVTL